MPFFRLPLFSSCVFFVYPLLFAKFYVHFFVHLRITLFSPINIRCFRLPIFFVACFFVRSVFRSALFRLVIFFVQHFSGNLFFRICAVLRSYIFSSCCFSVPSFLRPTLFSSIHFCVHTMYIHTVIRARNIPSRCFSFNHSVRGSAWLEYVDLVTLINLLIQNVNLWLMGF